VTAPRPLVTVRRIQPGDGPAFRDVRLRALQADPTAFASSYELEADRSPDSWSTWAAATSAGNDQAMFVAESGDRLVGLAGAFRIEGNPRSLHLIAMWVEPGFRGYGHGRTLTEAVVSWARQADADDLGLWVVAGNEVARHLYESCGFIDTGVVQPLPSHPDLIEHRLSLDLGPGPNAPLPSGYVELQPMVETEFDAYLEWTIADHTAHLMQAFDLNRFEAEVQARDAITHVLAVSDPSRNHHFCSIRGGLADESVGWIWFGEESIQGRPVATLFDIVVFERHRNQGLGTAAIDEVEEWARIRGLPVVHLAVFTHNEAARRLYKRLGFTVTKELPGVIQMEKKVAGS
jgi:ribosomal protein S18 acetylase RimI-like enzyme